MSIIGPLGSDSRGPVTPADQAVLQEQLGRAPVAGVWAAHGLAPIGIVYQD